MAPGLEFQFRGAARPEILTYAWFWALEVRVYFPSAGKYAVVV
jgi:hypothetical protein